MLFDQVTSHQMQAAQAFSGACMAGFLAAPLFGRFAGRVRIGVAGIYLAGVAAAAVYFSV